MESFPSVVVVVEKTEKKAEEKAEERYLSDLADSELAVFHRELRKPKRVEKRGKKIAKTVEEKVTLLNVKKEILRRFGEDGEKITAIRRIKKGDEDFFPKKEKMLEKVLENLGYISKSKNRDLVSMWEENNFPKSDRVIQHNAIKNGEAMNHYFRKKYWQHHHGRSVACHKMLHEKTLEFSKKRVSEILPKSEIVNIIGEYLLF